MKKFLSKFRSIAVFMILFVMSCVAGATLTSCTAVGDECPTTVTESSEMFSNVSEFFVSDCCRVNEFVSDGVKYRSFAFDTDLRGFVEIDDDDPYIGHPQEIKVLEKLRGNDFYMLTFAYGEKKYRVISSNAVCGIVDAGVYEEQPTNVAE